MTWVWRLGALGWAAFGLRYALASAEILPPPNLGNWWLAGAMFFVRHQTCCAATAAGPRDLGSRGSPRAIKSPVERPE